MTGIMALGIAAVPYWTSMRELIGSGLTQRSGGGALCLHDLCEFGNFASIPSQIGA